MDSQATLPEQPVEKYPILTELINHMQEDCPEGCDLQDKNDWQWPDNVEALEKEASKLPAEHRIEFAVGDYDMLIHHQARFGLDNVNRFLEDVFDGPLYKSFFK